MPFGVGAALAAALVFSPDNLALAVAYGAGAGVVIGAVFGVLAERILGRPGWRLQATALAAIDGVVVGGLVGGVAAWSVDAGVTNGLVLGGVAGATVGLLLAAAVLARGRRSNQPDQ